MGEAKRYALAALVEAAGMSEAELGRRVGLSGSSLTKARRDGLIESAADRYACRAGLVPWLVWSDWLEDLSVECAAEDCCERFVPARKGHVYHSQACARKAWARTEHGKASLAAAKNRWLETAWEYDRKRERERKRRIRAERRAVA